MKRNSIVSRVCLVAVTAAVLMVLQGWSPSASEQAPPTPVAVQTESQATEQAQPEPTKRVDAVTRPAEKSPLAHPHCRYLYQNIRRRGYHLNAMHGPVFSIEQKITFTFGEALRRAHQKRLGGGGDEAESGHGATPGVRRNVTRLSHGMECDRDEWLKSPVVVDIGVNDGEDTPTWYNEFGTWHDSCTSYLLFEPQSQYWGTIKQEVEGHYFRVPGRSKRDHVGRVPKVGPPPHSDLDQGEINKEAVALVISQLDDEDTTFFGPRTRNGVARRVVLLRAAVGPNNMHNKTVVLHGKGQSASIARIDSDAAVQKKADSSSIRLLSLMYVLNNFTDERQHITFLKIDCEGADATIMVSSEPLFAQQRVDFVMFEVNKVVRNFPTSIPEAVAMLRRNAYRCFLVGYDKKNQMLILSEVSEDHMKLWQPKLETVICLPAKSIDGDAATSMFPHGLVNGVRKLTEAEEDSYLRRMMQKATRPLSSCFMSMYGVPCPTCGGEAWNK